MKSRWSPVLALGLSFVVHTAVADTAAANAAVESSVERGRYVAEIGGCHDCHTPGYIMNGGTAPQALWLTGDTLGWSGPWGTTYAPNLRLRAADMDQKTWIAYARALKTRPPMPYWTLNRMSEDDLVSLWKMLKSLGKAGEPAPAALPPGVAAQGPVVTFPSPPPLASAERSDR